MAPRLTGRLRRAQGRVRRPLPQPENSWWVRERGLLLHDLFVGLIVTLGFGLILTAITLRSDANNTRIQNELAEEQADHAEVLENTRFIREAAMTAAQVLPFQGLNLNHADLSGLPLWCDRAKDVSKCAQLQKANLNYAALKGTLLDGAEAAQTTFYYAEMQHVQMGGADLSAAGLSYANMTGAGLSDSDLSGAALDSTDLSDANLWGANLINAHMNGTILTGSVLAHAHLQGVDLSRVVIGEPSQGWHLSADDGHPTANLNLEGAFLGGANISGLDLSSANLDDIEWFGNAPWTAPPESETVVGPGATSRLSNYEESYVLPGGGQVGGPCYRGTTWPKDYRPPEPMDCSVWDAAEES